jgi:hypothetical protein
MEKLDSQAAADLLVECCTGFYHAILIGVVLHLPRWSEARHAPMGLLAQDTEGRRRLVMFALPSLQELKLVEDRVSSLVLSDGLRIVLRDRRSL